MCAVWRLSLLSWGRRTTSSGWLVVVPAVAAGAVPLSPGRGPLKRCWQRWSLYIMLCSRLSAGRPATARVATCGGVGWLSPTSSVCLCSDLLICFCHFLKNIYHELYTVYLFILVGSMSVSYMNCLCTSGTGSVALRAEFNPVVRRILCSLVLCSQICVPFCY